MVFNRLPVGSGFIPGSVYVLCPQQPLFPSLNYLIKASIFGGFSRTLPGGLFSTFYRAEDFAALILTEGSQHPMPTKSWGKERQIGQGDPGGLWPDSPQVASVIPTPVLLASAPLQRAPAPPQKGLGSHPHGTQEEETEWRTHSSVCFCVLGSLKAR